MSRTLPFVASTVLPTGIDSSALSVRNLPFLPLILIVPDTTSTTTVLPTTGGGTGTGGVGAARLFQCLVAVSVTSPASQPPLLSASRQAVIVSSPALVPV